MSGIVIWITGLPGSGKSTVADAVKKRHPDMIILRMDNLRKVVTPDPAYSAEERDLVYRCLVSCAKTLSEYNHDVIIDATGNMRKWRDLARELIPAFAEVYLKCSREECRRREERRIETHGAPKNIYAKGERGWPVPGVNAPYEEPPDPELAIDADTGSVEDAAEQISSLIGRLTASSH